VNEHSGRVPLHHIDLYRIDDAEELREVGVAELLGGAGVAVVEWPERLSAMLPRERLEVRIEIVGPKERRITAHAVGDTPARRLRAWRAAEEARLSPGRRPLRGKGRQAR
jgi:tRNA threonylcarbamoyladenosine biosynthesis protein TsaE